jgi:hypothetical protein
MSIAAYFLITAYLPAETLPGIPFKGTRKIICHYALFYQKTTRDKIR